MEQTVDKVICITCPKGCTLDVTREGDTIVKIVQGCKRGHDYVRGETNRPAPHGSNHSAHARRHSSTAASVYIRALPQTAHSRTTGRNSQG